MAPFFIFLSHLAGRPKTLMAIVWLTFTLIVMIVFGAETYMMIAPIASDVPRGERPPGDKPAAEPSTPDKTTTESPAAVPQLSTLASIRPLLFLLIVGLLFGLVWWPRIATTETKPSTTSSQGAPNCDNTRGPAVLASPTFIPPALAREVGDGEEPDLPDTEVIRLLL